MILMKKLFSNELNILFASAGRRVSLLRHFRNVLDQTGLSGKIIAADLREDAPAIHVADIYEPVPRVSDPAYINRLKEICLKYNIGMLFSLIDTDLILLSEYKEEFKKLGVTIIVSDRETNKICFDKRSTYDFFKNNQIATPELFEIDDSTDLGKFTYPLLLKPASGSCGHGVTKINTEKELRFFLEYIDDPIVQEYIEGDEYTIDIYVDFSGKVRCVVPRLRMETRAGEVSKAVTVKDDELINLSKHVVEALPGSMGCITVQCFKTRNNEVKFIEINPRFGGGFPLSLKAGADYPLWIINEFLGRYSSIKMDGWQDGLVMLRYDDEIFVDGSR